MMERVPTLSSGQGLGAHPRLVAQFFPIRLKEFSGNMRIPGHPSLKEPFERSGQQTGGNFFGIVFLILSTVS